jgi:tRNA1(Val) A37 N6-methylase TrmN6
LRQGKGVQTTVDGFLGGALALEQPAKGYRAGLDAMLLAAACDAKPGERVLDVGCGAGAVMLAAARRLGQVAFVGVEADQAMASLARGNILRNGLYDQVSVIEGDVEQPFARLGEAAFDATVSNPPFFDDPGRLRAPSPERRKAWMNGGGLAAWIGFMMKASREGGTITLIHRADALPAILEALAPKAGSVVVRPVHPFADAPASRVLVRAVKVGKAPFRLLSPLVCQTDAATPSPELDSLMRGRAFLDW